MDLIEISKGHLEYYNSHPYFASAILGVNIAMEEAKANGEAIDEKDIETLLNLFFFEIISV